jgi:hypothetical protein
LLDRFNRKIDETEKIDINGRAFPAHSVGNLNYFSNSGRINHCRPSFVQKPGYINPASVGLAGKPQGCKSPDHVLTWSEIAKMPEMKIEQT